MNRPASPTGLHVHELRLHMALNQTDFASLLRSAQSTVSHWEAQRREELLPPELAERFLEVWECFASRPSPASFAEASSLLAEYRRQKAALPAPSVTDAQPPTPQALSWPIHFARGPLPPGTHLVETGPLVPVGDPSSMTRTFAAVMGKDPSPSPVPGAEPKSKTVRGRSARGGRIAATLAMTATLSAFAWSTGCMISHPVLREAERTECDMPVSDQTSTGNTPAVCSEASASPKRSDSTLEQRFPWQKLAPCAPGEIEAAGRCWLTAERRPPCPNYAIESDGKCLIAIPAPPKPPTPPNSETPKQ